MRGVNRVDALVAGAFVVAAITEAVLRQQATTWQLVFSTTGSLWLGSLALRRRHPLIPICVIAAVSVLGTVLTSLLWPQSADGGGVWIFAMMLACYSLGAHRAGRIVVLGVVFPLAVVVAADVSSMSGWDRINGILFITTFVGLLPTAVGTLVRVRHERLEALQDQQERIVQAQRAQQQSAVLAERLRTAERLQPTLLQGLQAIATAAESEQDPGGIETRARALLTRTREEVLALTAPAPAAEVAVADAPQVDHLRALRLAAQPWTVIVAGAIVAGLSVESTRALELNAPGLLVLPASLLVGVPLALTWWRPVSMVALAWAAVAAFSRLVAPLDGSLSESAFALAATFAVATLSRRRTAMAGLLVCWLGQLVGVGTGDPLGEAVFLLVCWLGGLAVNEVSQLVEQARANNELLDGQEAASAARAVVEEQLRLAREIHDAVGHSLTVVALQAGAARRVAGIDPERAREVMRTVATVARSGVAALALDDVTADIATLIERVRAAGLVIDADLTGEALLAPAQRVTAFRVVQEGLTNVLRHAPGSRARVTVRRGDDGIEIVVSNTAPADVASAPSGAGTAPAGTGPGSGRGLAGIRERLAGCAGQVAWMPLRDGGFEVRALLPATTLAVTAS